MSIVRRRPRGTTFRGREPSAAAALCLLLLSPVCGEFLIGYDDITGDPVAMLFALAIFAALYGAPTLLIREVARRRGLGWPAVLLLGVAFGLLEAGLVDQSLFHPDYRGIPGWGAMYESTLLPGIGTSAFMVVHFVSGHALGAVWSPIVMVEALFPARRAAPWLNGSTAVLLAALWALSATFVVWDQSVSDPFQISVTQAVLPAAAIAVMCLIALRPVSFRGPSLRRPMLRKRRMLPSPVGVGITTAVLLGFRLFSVAIPVESGYQSFTWGPTAAMTLLTAGWVVLMLAWSRDPRWSRRHLHAAAWAYLLSLAASAFVTIPLGDVPLAAKLATNTLLATLVVVVGLAGRR